MMDYTIPEFTARVKDLNIRYQDNRHVIAVAFSRLIGTEGLTFDTVTKLEVLTNELAILSKHIKAGDTDAALPVMHGITAILVQLEEKILNTEK